MQKLTLMTLLLMVLQEANLQHKAIILICGNGKHVLQKPKFSQVMPNQDLHSRSSPVMVKKKSSKGSTDPIIIFNKFSSADDMDLQMNLSPKRGPVG